MAPHENPAGRDRPANADIARAAGVSAMTVSRVLNDQPGVGDETRARVQALIEELGYRPNPTAVALRRGRNRVLAYVTPTAELRGTVDTLIGVERAASAAGWSVSIQALEDVTDEALRAVRLRLRDSAVDVAVVVSPLASTAEALRELDATTPAVGIWTPRGALADAVAAEAIERAADLAVRHLLDDGHRTVAHISGPEGWMVTEHQTAAWERALRDLGAEVIPAVAGDWTADRGHEAARELLADPRVTAIFAANDHTALGAMRAAKDAGRAVPADLSVLGFGDLPEARHYQPALSSVGFRADLLGEEAFRAAMVRIGEIAADTPSIDLGVALHLRESTAPR